MPRTSPPFLPARKGENIFQRQSLAYRHYNIKKREKQQFTNFYAKRPQKFLDFSGNASAVAAALKERYALRSVFPLHCSGRRTHEPLIFVHNFFAKPCVFPCDSTKNTAIHPFPCGFPSFFYNIHFFNLSRRQVSTMWIFWWTTPVFAKTCLFRRQYPPLPSGIPRQMSPFCLQFFHTKNAIFPPLISPLSACFLPHFPI